MGLALQKNQKSFTLRTRPPLDRMLQIDAEIRGKKLPNCSTLARKFEVSRKTVVRDIEFMRYRLDLPIEFDPVRNGYFYSKPVGQFPLMHVTSGELLALFVARKSLEQYRGTPFELPLRNALEKITSQIHDEISFSWKEFEGVFSFSSGAPASPDVAIFDVVSRAVMEKRELTFSYRKLNSSRFEDREVRPYHLACISGLWYLFAFDKTREKLRTFVLARMRDPVMKRIGFKRPDDFSLAAILANSFGVVEGRNPVEVTIRFDAFAAQLIRERVWHASQKLSEVGNGELELSLTLGSFIEIEPWILSWGGHAEVLAPEDLRQKISHSLSLASSRYKK